LLTAVITSKNVYLRFPDKIWNSVAYTSLPHRGLSLLIGGKNSIPIGTILQTFTQEECNYFKNAGYGSN